MNFLIEYENIYNFCSQNLFIVRYDEMNVCEFNIYNVLMYSLFLFSVYKACSGLLEDAL